MRRNRYQKGFLGARNYGRKRLFGGRSYEDYGRSGGFFSNQSDTGWEETSEIHTVTTSLLGFLVKLGEKGKSVLKTQPLVKVNSFTYASCQKEGDYLELECEVESR